MKLIFFQSYYILFEYDSKTEELILKLTNPDEIPLLFNVNNVEKMISDLLESDVKKLPDEPLFVYLVSILVIQPLADAKNFSHHLLKESPEIYEKLKGRFSSEDLVLFPEFKVSDDKKHIVLPKTIEGGSNMKK